MATCELSGFTYLLHNEKHSHRPALLLLHKTGGDESELLPLAQQVAPDWPAIAVRGNAIEEGKRRFFRRLSPGVFDEVDIVKNAEALSNFIAEVTLKNGLRPPIALGLSNGANIAAALMYLHPTSLSGAILLRPTAPFKTLPSTALTGVKVLCTIGSNDEVVPLAQTNTLLEDLERNGAEVSRKVIEAGHRIASGDVPVIRSWLKSQFPG